MCLFGLLFGLIPNYPVIMLHNREEDLERDFTENIIDKDGIVAPRDTNTDGVWLGFSSINGSFVAITNHRNKKISLPNIKECTSRGQLTKWLLREAPKVSHHQILTFKEKYYGFNIIYGYPTKTKDSTDEKDDQKKESKENSFQIFLITNRPKMEDILQTKSTFSYDSQALVCELPSGIHAISNGYLNDTQIWTRVRFLSKYLHEWCENSKHSDVVQELQQIISNDEPFDEKEIPSQSVCDEFSPYPYQFEHICHTKLFFNPYVNPNERTVSQSILMIESEQSKSEAPSNYIYHFFHRDSRKKESLYTKIDNKNVHSNPNPWVSTTWHNSSKPKNEEIDNSTEDNKPKH
ncbi:hypothetical protein RFI_27909 [Reticulomyxa filosa]|uniref:Uncharacterized protein n=1 Tax=Reticulomyxa filosa TaxID=46433 RepID=X6M6D7_RETFI|nr:hypothetical protein RFI_27909 [Reticulomyxa filosa]|eukprot:ETO09464.1 hypothetical protein RFI_27909 [Reticulomyxa filosa]